MLVKFLAGLSLLGAVVPVAHARTWGFDKDTVFEWTSQAAGWQAKLSNAGPDTVKLDSVIAEGIPSPWGQVTFSFYPVETGGSPFYLRYPDSVKSLAPKRVLPGSYAVFYDMDVSALCAIVKRAADAAISAAGDTVSARLRFKSKASEEDTLIVVGLKYCPTGVDPGAGTLPNGSTGATAGIPGRDALGRDVKRAPQAPALLLRPSK